jgi:DNA invertase Pin-like site-specific DNA recombinase
VSGARAARARGKVLGRPRRVFKRDEVATRRAAGESWGVIAKTLGVPVSTVRDAARVAEIVSGRPAGSVVKQNLIPRPLQACGKEPFS